MSEIKITDLVPQETIDKIKELDAELQTLLSNYTNTAKELAKGINIDVKVIGDIDKLEKLLVEKTKEAAVSTEKLNAVMTEQSRVIGNTTNAISRHLMEQERSNKAQQEAYKEQERVQKLLERYYDSYENQTKELAKYDNQLAANKKAMAENKKAYEQNRISATQYYEKQGELIARHRELTLAKRDLSQIMTKEEKSNMSSSDAYGNMSQQLELLKTAYKRLSEEGRNSDFGKEMEASIQNLDAHLKDLAANMGEFQRNVGNYAIAGQNGVVTTESVIAAMSREAVTTQDLVDQTKILGEAKMMLDKQDAAYQSTLDALNAKIEENRRKLTDVSDIMDKQATSVAEAEAQNKRLHEALKNVDLSSDGAQKRVKELNDKIAANTKLIRENTPAIEEQRKANEGLAGSLLDVIGLNGRFGSSLKGLENANTANVLDGLSIKTQAFGKTLLGIVSNPWILAFLGIAGVVAGFKWWYDYNKGLIEASRLTKNFTGLTGEAADKVTADMQAIADHMGKGFDETMEAANTLVQQFGLSWDEAMTLMQDGIVAGADMSGNMLNNIKQFAPALRDAGVSADEFMAILAETRNGIFDERGVQDIVKAGTRLRAMSKQTADSLNAIGISSKQMQKDLKDGTISMMDAVQQVAGKLKELPENSQEAGNVMKNVFGRTASEGGTLLIKSIADVNTNLDKAKENMGELGRLNDEQMKAQKELNETLAAVFKLSDTSFEEMTVSAKTFILQGLDKIIKGCADIANWFIRMYNGSKLVRGGVNYIVMAFQNLWEVAKLVLGNVVNTLKTTGAILEDIFTGNWDKIGKDWQDGLKTWSGDLEAAIKKVASNTADAFNKTMEDEIGYIDVNLKGNTDDAGNSPDKPKANPDPNPVLSDEELAKRAKEELKRLQELEDAKIAVMKDGHEKDLAMIRAKFKKKLDEITGNGETEKALRIQLAEQCEKEVADCEKKYQENLSKINLDNRLAAVKKGSKEELDLKLAQLEAKRKAELEEAEKTGADVNLINVKFDVERLKMQEDYASACADLIQKRYAKEQAERDNAMVSELNDLKKKYAEELKLVDTNEKKKAELKKKYEEDTADVTERYAKETAQASVDMLEKILENEDLSAEEREKIEEALAKAKVDLNTVAADAAVALADDVTENEEEEAEKRKKAIQKWLQIAADAMNAINDLASAIYDGKIQQVEEEQEANEEAGEKEQERIAQLVEQNVITEEEGEARKRAAADRTAKKDEELEKKKQQLKYKQAVWDKANSAVQATIATALGITKAFPNWVLMALVAAMGAIQLATILATPIPKYAKGTDYHRGGPAIVGDGGRQEVVLMGNTAWLTPNKPTLVDIPAGASVIPSVQNLNGNAAELTVLPLQMDGGVSASGYDDTNMRRGVSELIYLIKCQTRQQHNDAYVTNHQIYKNNV